MLKDKVKQYFSDRPDRSITEVELRTRFTDAVLPLLEELQNEDVISRRKVNCVMYKLKEQLLPTDSVTFHKVLLITKCNDPLKWYSSLVGKHVIFIRDERTEYKSREREGFTNFVSKTDCEVRFFKELYISKDNLVFETEAELHNYECSK